jgi:hypothetical protein
LKIAKELSGEGNVRKKKYKDLKKRVGNIISRFEVGNSLGEISTTAQWAEKPKMMNVFQDFYLGNS